jgi:hypothetical protein
MGWLRKRFGEGNTLAGMAMLYMIVRPIVPPQYSIVVDAVASVIGVGGVVVPGNSTPK